MPADPNALDLAALAALAALAEAATPGEWRTVMSASTDPQYAKDVGIVGGPPPIPGAALGLIGEVWAERTRGVYDGEVAKADAAFIAAALAAEKERGDRAEALLLQRCDELQVCMDEPVARQYDGGTTRAYWREAREAFRRALGPRP